MAPCKPKHQITMPANAIFAVTLAMKPNFVCRQSDSRIKCYTKAELAYMYLAYGLDYMTALDVWNSGCTSNVTPEVPAVSLHCNIATPNSGRHLWWTRHPHVHLAAAVQPLFDPRAIGPRRPEDERERCFELTWER
ncbi:hypothetical protein TNCV_1553231 [Trichonephila clavipes]|nr:hypothetical protein TNCV_1553231 [Trichonephila clavipes]